MNKDADDALARMQRRVDPPWWLILGLGIGSSFFIGRWRSPNSNFINQIWDGGIAIIGTLIVVPLIVITICAWFGALVFLIRRLCAFISRTWRIGGKSRALLILIPTGLMAIGYFYPPAILALLAILVYLIGILLEMLEFFNP